MKDEEKKIAENGTKLTDAQIKGITGGLIRTPEPEITEEAVGEDLPTRNAKTYG